MNERIEGLEGMRGIAAFLVYTHHFFLIFYPAFYFGQHTWINHFLNPDLAVSWFFVHSGFVLSYKSRNSSKDILWKNLLDQSLRRYLRLLFPVLLSIILTYFIMSLDLQFNIQYGKLVNSTWLQKYLNFQPNLWDAIKQSFHGVYFHFNSSTTYNPNLWTIGYELISSYILFLVLAVFGWWRKSHWLLIPIALLAGPWKGLICFFLGASLTRVADYKQHPFFIGFITALGFFLSDLKGPYESYARNIAAALLMFSLLNSPKLRSWLGTRYIRFLGDISYSLYVLHFLILISFTSWIGLKWNAHQNVMEVFAIYLMTTIILLLVSYLGWKLVDKPGIQIAKNFSQLIRSKIIKN